MSSEQAIPAKPAHRASLGAIRKLLVILAGLAFSITLVLVALLNWPLPAMPRPGVTGDFLVRDVAVVDVVNGGILSGRDVVVRDGRIESIDASKPPSGQGALVVVEGTGKFLVPGLWDMHVHSQKIAPQYNHPLLIANGITGVREMWGCAGLPDSFLPCHEDIESWGEGLRDRSQLAPRYIQRSSFAINGEGGVPADAPAFFRARNADEARKLVAHHADDGADFLKTYTNLSVAAYDALALEAPRRGCSWQDIYPCAFHWKPRLPQASAASSTRGCSCSSASKVPLASVHCRVPWPPTTGRRRCRPASSTSTIPSVALNSWRRWRPPTRGGHRRCRCFV